MNDIEILENIKTKEELYKYIMKRLPTKLPLEHEIFAIRNHDFHNLDYAIYVDGYISIDAIIKNIKKEQAIENLLKERKADKETIKQYRMLNANIEKANNIINIVTEEKQRLQNKVSQLTDKEGNYIGGIDTLARLDEIDVILEKGKGE